jgi:hypothetical protein
MPLSRSFAIARLARGGAPEEARVAPLVLSLRLLPLECAAELALAEARVLLAAEDPHAGGSEAGEHRVRCLPRPRVRGDEAEDGAAADLRGEAIPSLLSLECFTNAARQ